MRKSSGRGPSLATPWLGDQGQVTVPPWALVSSSTKRGIVSCFMVDENPHPVKMLCNYNPHQYRCSYCFADLLSREFWDHFRSRTLGHVFIFLLVALISLCLVWLALVYFGPPSLRYWELLKSSQWLFTFFLLVLTSSWNTGSQQGLLNESRGLGQ